MNKLLVVCKDNDLFSNSQTIHFFSLRNANAGQTRPNIHYDKTVPKTEFT